MKSKIAVLGPAGTFSHQAAKVVDGEHETVFEKTIHDVFVAVQSGKCEKGVVPIENSVGGSVGFTMDALLDFDLSIEQEEIIPVVHNLMGLSGLQASDIKTLYVHPQTYSQCEQYIRKHIPEAEIFETSSNGESAHLVSEKKDKNAAAIGPEIAASEYGLEIIAKAVQDNRFNVTRFIVISKEKTKPTGYDRTSITVYPQIDKPGLLYEILGYFAKEKVNLSKIESRPSKGKLGDYIFYIDLQGHAKDEPVKKVLSQLEKIAFVKNLGSYPRKY